jgi:phage shock protein C
MFCTSCGNSMDDKANFCGNCGQRTGQFNGTAQTGRPSAQRLERPVDSKWLAGVCAAFANYFKIDVTLVRLLWLCSVIIVGTGVLAYIICWAVIPTTHYPIPETQRT